MSELNKQGMVDILENDGEIDSPMLLRIVCQNTCRRHCKGEK